MKTKILIILIIGVVLAAGGFSVYKNWIAPEIKRPEVEKEIGVPVIGEEVPPEEEIIETPAIPKEKLTCPYQCCINEIYKSKTCSLGYECKENKCVEKPAEKPATAERHFPAQALAQLGLAVAPDGKTAYIPSELEDSLLVVDLSTFTVTDSIDVSVAGNMLMSSAVVLSPDGKRLYVSNAGTGNVMVIDTDNKRVERVLPLKPLHVVAISISRDGSKVYIPSVDGGLYIISTSDQSYRQIFVPGVIFGPVVPSSNNPDLLYAVGKVEDLPVMDMTPSFFTFNISSNTVVRYSSLTNEILPSNVFARRLIVNSNETTAYFGWLVTADKGSGNFITFDLNSFQVLTSVPMEYGVSDFAVNEKTGKAYILGFWSGGGAPNNLPILEYDISTNKVVRKIPLSPSGDQRAIVIDPTNINHLYMTEGDWDIIRKVDITTGKEVRKLQFYRGELSPYAIIRGDNTGYITCHNCGRVYKLDLRSGQLIGSIPLPEGVSQAGGYYQDRLYFSGGRYIYSINPSNGSLIKKFDIGIDINPGILTFFDDKMVTTDFYPGAMVGKRLLFFNARNMSILKSIELPAEPHGDKVVVSPDGSKLYVERGQMMGGTTVITIYNASTFEVINIIEIPPEIGRRGATGFARGYFDETNRILYLTGFASVYKINMDTDKLIGILDLVDVYELRGLWGWSPTGLSGVAVSPAKDKLFVISTDAHSMYIYDLIKSSWTTKITNLKGYFNTDAISSPDRQHLYTVNNQSDSITMVDLTSGDVVKIIRLE